MPPLKKGEESLLFVVEHFDPLPRLKKEYLLKVFVSGGRVDVEMTDLKTNKKFLKKSPAPEHIGAWYILGLGAIPLRGWGVSVIMHICLTDPIPLGRWGTTGLI